MEKRTLGTSLAVGKIGLGCMGMSEFYGETYDRESALTITTALAHGVTMLDTADMYGPFKNEILIADALLGNFDERVIATKFGIERAPDGTLVGINGSPEYVKRACDASLARLRVDRLDLYYQHRVDKRVPIEETWGALKELVEAGKVAHLGISEASPATIERAHAVHPVTAVQMEYSLWSRDPEDGVLDTCRRLGIGFVAYSPLGRGFLTDDEHNRSGNRAGAYRANHPRFTGRNGDINRELVASLADLAHAKGCTTAQLALAWVLHQGDDIVAIPGTKQRTRLLENIAAGDIVLTADELATIEATMPRDKVAGPRYPESSMSSLEG